VSGLCPLIFLYFPFKISQKILWNAIALRELPGEKAVSPTQLLQVTLSILFQISNTQLILGHEGMIPSHQIFTFLFPLALNLLPNYAWWEKAYANPLANEQQVHDAI
jgi:hypothetical protein